MELLQKQLREELLSIQHVTAFGPHFEPFTDSLRGEVLKCSADLGSLIEAAKSREHQDHHVDFAYLQRRARALLGEAFALKLADSIRTHADKGICQIGDKLLAEFAAAVTLRVPQLTTVGDSEFYSSSSRVIRLRYPVDSIWDLPILAHEFAHFFGPLWTAQNARIVHPHESFVLSAGLGSPMVNDEYFCDLLATFLLGPAYVCACILERFVATADKDGATHPSDSKRAWWVLKGLELLAGLIDDEDDKLDFSSVAEDLRLFWTRYLRAAGVRELDEPEIEKLEGAIERLFEQLKRELRLAPYISPCLAWGLAADYKEQLFDRHRLGVTVRDILNAAWFVRLEACKHETNCEPALGNWALSLIRRLN
jgi:hypothetical protein